MIDIDVTIAQLNSADRIVRHEAVEALGCSKDKKAIAPLSAILKDRDPGIRDAAVNGLVNIGGKEAANAVIPMLYEEDDASIRNIAIEILERLDGDAKEAVITLLKEEDADILKFAIDIIAKIGRFEDAPCLTPILSHKNPNVRAAAVAALGKIKAFQAAHKLIDMLKDEDEWVRFSVLEALGSLGSYHIISILLNEVEVREDGVLRIAALDALSNLVFPKDYRKIISVIGRPDVSSVISAETAARFAQRFNGFMCDSHKKVFLDIFTGRLEKGDLHEKREALKGIRLINDERAIDALICFAAMVDETDEESKELLKHALVTIGNSAVIVEALEKDIGNKSVLAEALGEIGDPSTIDEIKSLLHRVDRETEKALLKSLEKISSASSFETLVDALHDKDGHVRGLAAKALGRLGDKMAAPILLEALVKEPYPDVQERIGEVLSGYKGDEMKDLFIKLLSHEKPAMRIIAVKSLGRLKGKGAKEILAGMLTDNEPMVRKEAVKSLGEFEGEDISDVVSGSFRDDNASIRLAALEVIGARNGGQSRLMELLKDENMWVRFRAVEILGERKANEAEDAIMNLLSRDELPIKIVSVKALGRLGSKKALPLLKDFVYHSDPYLSAAAKDAVAIICGN